MNKITLTLIWTLAVLEMGITMFSLSPRSPGPIEIFEVLIYGWMFLPSLLLAATAYRVFHKKMPRPWSSSMLIASIVYALFYFGMFIDIFFSDSSTAAIGLVVAPGVAGGAAAFAGWIVHLVFQSRHHDGAA